jgi:hypothetical protein
MTSFFKAVLSKSLGLAMVAKRLFETRKTEWQQIQDPSTTYLEADDLFPSFEILLFPMDRFEWNLQRNTGQQLD